MFGNKCDSFPMLSLDDGSTTVGMYLQVVFKFTTVGNWVCSVHSQVVCKFQLLATVS